MKPKFKVVELYDGWMTENALGTFYKTLGFFDEKEEAEKVVESWKCSYHGNAVFLVDVTNGKDNVMFAKGKWPDVTRYN